MEQLKKNLEKCNQVCKECGNQYLHITEDLSVCSNGAQKVAILNVIERRTRRQYEANGRTNSN